jgi:hypothetical protein
MTEEKKTNRKGKGFDDWWEERILPQKILLGIGFGILGIGFLALLGLAVMLLWNWLIPDIFGLKQLNYWQAWGLLILCTILFKGMNFKDKSNSTDKKRRKQLRSYIKEEQENEENLSPDMKEK